MRLRVVVPTHTEVDEEVEAVTAEAPHGSFGLLPRHVDFVSPLVPGLVSYRSGGGERYVAVDGGLLVKVDGDVRVSTPRATRGGDLGEVRRLLHESFLDRDERERRALEALRRLEADLVHRISELEGERAR